MNEISFSIFLHLIITGESFEGIVTGLGIVKLRFNTFPIFMPYQEIRYSIMSSCDILIESDNAGNSGQKQTMSLEDILLSTMIGNLIDYNILKENVIYQGKSYTKIRLEYTNKIAHTKSESSLRLSHLFPSQPDNVLVAFLTGILNFMKEQESRLEGKGGTQKGGTSFYTKNGGVSPTKQKSETQPDLVEAEQFLFMLGRGASVQGLEIAQSANHLRSLLEHLKSQQQESDYNNTYGSPKKYMGDSIFVNGEKHPVGQIIFEDVPHIMESNNWYTLNDEKLGYFHKGDTTHIWHLTYHKLHLYGDVYRKNLLDQHCTKFKPRIQPND